MTLGENVKRFRIEKGMSQKELAKEVGASVSMICQIERGARSPSVALTFEISRVLNKSIQELLHGERRKDERSNHS